eukprot:scaffold115566_cov55-Cyclotella_meneghiniana.AAC.8
MTASFIARGLIVTLLAISSYTASSFQLPHSTSLHQLSHHQPRRSLSSPTSLHSENNPQEQEVTDVDLIGSISSSSSTQSSIDWDAEWKKVLENKDQPSSNGSRLKGNDEKSELEMRASAMKKKAERAVARNVFDASESMKRGVVDRMPSWRSLQGDWKFWIGIIVVISFGLSILSVSGPTTSANESFYI